ncbi:MAG: TIGR04282 family arsenosugar biosynthesis glycosyltransferase [Desulfobaccales bacterium]
MLIIFAKEPTPGQVKTRLCPPLSHEAAARLYGQFLEDVLGEMARLTEMAIALAYTPELARPFFQKVAIPGTHLVAQTGDDLGERLRQAFAWGFAQGAAAVMIRNSDSPDLPASVVMEAKEVLRRGQTQVVLGPCPDGGYYLVGLKSPQPELFQGITWSGPTVLVDTLARAHGLGLTVHLLPPWRDIDTVEDLRALVETPKTSPSPGWRSYELAKTLLAGL